MHQQDQIPRGYYPATAKPVHSAPGSTPAQQSYTAPDSAAERAGLQVNDKIIQESSKTLEIKFYKYSEIEVVGLLYRIIEAGLPPTNINRISKEEYGIPYENVEVKLLIDREDFQRYEIFYRQWLYTPWDRTKALELFPQTAHLNIYPDNKFKLSIDCSHSARCELLGKANTLYYFIK